MHATGAVRHGKTSKTVSPFTPTANTSDPHRTFSWPLLRAASPSCNELEQHRLDPNVSAQSLHRWYLRKIDLSLEVAKLCTRTTSLLASGTWMYVERHRPLAAAGFGTLRAVFGRWCWGGWSWSRRWRHGRGRWRRCERGLRWHRMCYRLDWGRLCCERRHCTWHCTGNGAWNWAGHSTRACTRHCTRQGTRNRTGHYAWNCIRWSNAYES